MFLAGTRNNFDPSNVEGLARTVADDGAQNNLLSAMMQTPAAA
jgi:hypothetical protein